MTDRKLKVKYIMEYASKDADNEFSRILAAELEKEIKKEQDMNMAELYFEIRGIKINVH